MIGRWLFLASALTGLALAAPAGAQGEAPASFTQAQADRGAETYAVNCSLCHGAKLNDGEFGPPLNGARFKRLWGGNSAAGLFLYLSASMPPSRTGTLRPEDYADLMALLFRANGAAPGEKPLPASAEGLSGLTVPK